MSSSNRTNWGGGGGGGKKGELDFIMFHVLPLPKHKEKLLHNCVIKKICLKA